MNWHQDTKDILQCVHVYRSFWGVNISINHAQTMPITNTFFYLSKIRLLALSSFDSILPVPVTLNSPVRRYAVNACTRSMPGPDHVPLCDHLWLPLSCSCHLYLRNHGMISNRAVMGYLLNEQDRIQASTYAHYMRKIYINLINSFFYLLFLFLLLHGFYLLCQFFLQFVGVPTKIIYICDFCFHVRFSVFFK